MSTLQSLLPLLFIAAIFGVPILGLIAFVQWRAKRRRAALEGPWTAVANQWGGSYTTGRVFCDRGDHQLSLTMKLVSVMQAASGPYYPDGGTYTNVRLAFQPGGPTVVSNQDGALVSTAELASMVPAAQALPAFARVVLGQYEAVIVLEGAVADAQVLNACAATVEAIAQHVRQYGPIGVRAAA